MGVNRKIGAMGKPVGAKHVQLALDSEGKRTRILENLFALYEAAAADCIKNGCIMQTKTGYEQVRPQYTAMNDLLDKIMMLSPEFQKLITPEKEPKKGPGRPPQTKTVNFDLE